MAAWAEAVESLPPERLKANQAPRLTAANTVSSIAGKGSAGAARKPRATAAPMLGLLRCCGSVRPRDGRSEEHTSELPSLMRPSYAVFCLKKHKQHTNTPSTIKMVQYDHHNMLYHHNITY